MTAVEAFDRGSALLKDDAAMQALSERAGAVASEAERLPVQRAREILHGPCQCGRSKRGAMPFCAVCARRVPGDLRFVVNNTEMAEPFLTFYMAAQAAVRGEGIRITWDGSDGKPAVTVLDPRKYWRAIVRVRVGEEVGFADGSSGRITAIEAVTA